MNNKEDLLLREKIESVGTLQGGIVYGKEEAWEKLQARMDKKPVRVLPWRTILAAAAIPLLVTGIILYRFMQPATVTNNEYTQHTQPANNPTNVQHTASAPITTVAATTTAQPALANTIAKLPATPTLAPITTGIPVAQNIQAPLMPLATITPPAAKQKMRVLHINELDNPVADDQATVDNNGDWRPSLMTEGKMRTMHINDVARQDEEDRLAPRAAKPSFGNITFFKKPSPEQMGMNNDLQDRGHGLFRINTGTQN